MHINKIEKGKRIHMICERGTKPCERGTKPGKKNEEETEERKGRVSREEKQMTFIQVWPIFFTVI
jgi:hypothetical protein